MAYTHIERGKSAGEGIVFTLNSWVMSHICMSHVARDVWMSHGIYIHREGRRCGREYRLSYLFVSRVYVTKLWHERTIYLTHDYVVSHIWTIYFTWMCHVTLWHMDESCHIVTYEWESCHTVTWMSHVALRHVNESRHTGMSHVTCDIWVSHVIHTRRERQWCGTHVNESCHIWRMNESCHTHT